MTATTSGIEIESSNTERLMNQELAYVDAYQQLNQLSFEMQSIRCGDNGRNTSYIDHLTQA